VHVRLVWTFRVLRPLARRRLIILYYAKLKIDFYPPPSRTNIPKFNPALNNLERIEYKKELSTIVTTHSQRINILYTWSGWQCAANILQQSTLNKRISCIITRARRLYYKTILFVTSTASTILFCSRFHEFIFVFQLISIKIRCIPKKTQTKIEITEQREHVIHIIKICTPIVFDRS